MKLVVFSLLFGILQFISFVECSSYVLITVNEREKDVRIYRDSGKLYVSLEYVPFKDYHWLLENEEEVFQSSLEPINLVPSNDGPYTVLYDSGKVVIFEFSIPETDEALDNLPSTLKFVYTPELFSSRVNPRVEVHAIVHLNPVYDIDNTTCVDSISMKQGTSREDTLSIKPEEPFMVSLWANLTSGEELNLDNYSWYLDFGKMSIGKVVNHVELMNVGSTGTEEGANYFFIFRVTNITDQELPPRLRFNLKKKREDILIKASYILNLRYKSDTSKIVFDGYNLDYSKINKQFDFTREEILALEFRVPDQFYHWFLINAEEVRVSSGLDLINVDKEMGYAPFIVDHERMDDSSGITIFRIRATESTPIGDIQPPLQFVYSSYSGDEVFWKAEVTLHLKEGTNATIKTTTTSTSISPTSDLMLDCPAIGYPCCSDPNSKVYYHDDEGDWGVENKKWCFIPDGQKEEKKNDDDKKNKNKEEPRLIRTCNSEKHGYSCCRKEQKVVYTDNEGDW